MAIRDGVPWGLWVTSTADELARALDDRDYLNRVADRALEVAVDLRCSSLVGASESGRKIAAAASSRSHGRPLAGDPGRVLLVDGFLATGTNLVAAATRARQDGAKAVAVFVALADADAVDAVRRDLSAQVVALELAA